MILSGDGTSCSDLRDCRVKYKANRIIMQVELSLWLLIRHVVNNGIAGELLGELT